jgi:hypothetical protein
MRMIAYLLAIVCVAAAAMYYLMPAGQLPTFIPGYAPGSTAIHLKHAYAAAGAAIVLFLIGWFVGRRKAA